MARGGKMKAKVEHEDDDEQPPKPSSVIELSSDEEANEDLSSKIVEKARSRAAKRKKEADVDEFRASEGFKSASIIIISSSDEVELIADRSGGGAISSCEAATPGVRTKKKKKKKKKTKTDSVKTEEKEKTVDILTSKESAKAVAAGVLQTEDLVYTIHTEKRDESVEKEAPHAVDTEDLVYTVHTEKIAEGVETNAVERSDNIVLRKLLRGPRYFDPPSSSLSTCYNCGEEGHIAVNCSSKKRKKPCFVCGSFEHGVRNCTKGKDCYICKKGGHRAKNCPEKNQQSALKLDICLRCGESGHDMFSCTNDYDPEDLKQIQCYVCNKFGHLCCVDNFDTGTGVVACYNCGQQGHSGSACAKQRGEIGGASTSTLCYKCGEAGHFARGCTNSSKPDRRVAGTSTPIKKFKKAWDSPGFQSVPHDLQKVHQKKHAEYEGRDFVTPEKTRRRGGWITDDPGDLPNRKFRSNVWVPPTTPSNNYYRTPNFPSGGNFSNSGSPWNNHNYNHGTPSSHGSGNFHQHRYSASRFGNSGGGWDGRTYGW